MTFHEIARQANSFAHRDGYVAAMALIGDLAQAMDRLEHNLARQFALDHAPPAPRMGKDGAAAMSRWERALDDRRRRELESLRAEPERPSVGTW